jgi:proteasome lid subunit RPN8/RPN11
LSADFAHSGIDFKADTRVSLPERILSEIRSHVAHVFPEECCGLLIGNFEEGVSTKTVMDSRRMQNVFAKEERYHRFTIDPKEFLKAENEAESRGLEIVGIYHSHPNAPARPSQFDIAHAWPTLSYVVVEARDSKAMDTRSWVLKEDRTDFVEEKIYDE